ncbi:MAG: hypothetical protein LBJ73_02050 [Rickettsiales bacterium]|jgi:hypothetical protein|nr:hypothetical protein [Rickettsiales bacterium]
MTKKQNYDLLTIKALSAGVIAGIALMFYLTKNPDTLDFINMSKSDRAAKKVMRENITEMLEYDSLYRKINNDMQHWAIAPAEDCDLMTKTDFERIIIHDKRVLSGKKYDKVRYAYCSSSENFRNNIIKKTAREYHK